MTAVFQQSLPPPHRWIAAERASDVEITQAVAEPLFEPAGKVWWIAMFASLPFVLWFAGSIGFLFYQGIGIWGVNSTIVWGVAIANYVWWIGIGNAGTLDQPFRGGDDAFRRRHRRHYADHPSGPPNLCLLARPLPQHDGALAAVAQRAGLGFLGDRQLPAVFDPVLVRQPDS
jgi:hypothetical protein